MLSNSLVFTDMEDACMWEFTPGQINKMERDVKQFKPTLMKNVYSKQLSMVFNRIRVRKM